MSRPPVPIRQSGPGRSSALVEIFQDAGADGLPKIDFHIHTTWTDGENSVQDMYDAAVEAGLVAVLFSEHARATSWDWFPKFAAEVRALPQGRCRAYVGTEAKILNFEGNIDICDSVRNECDVIMASVHRFPGETSIYQGNEAGYTFDQVVETEFELARAGLRAGGFDILGHPFGMTYRRFGYVPPEHLIRELVRECAKANIAFEINARYHTNPIQFISWCRAERAPISLGSNAHNVAEVGALQRFLGSKS